jgi:hypothetical protein
MTDIPVLPHGNFVRKTPHISDNLTERGGRKPTIKDIFDQLSVMSDSEFATLASGEHGEDLLASIVGACGRAIEGGAND